MTAGADRLAPILLCDLDGTVIDSAPDLAASLSALLAEHGRRGLDTDEIKPMVGDGVAKLVERAFAATGGVPADGAMAASVARYSAIYECRLTRLTRPYPGALDTLGALRAAGWRLAVCTNKPERASHEIVRALGMDALFEALAGGDTFAVRKPDPGHLLHLIARMNGDPARAVMLGDSHNDVRAARDAGLPVIAISHGYGTVPARALGADRVIDSFAELPDTLAALKAG